MRTIRAAALSFAALLVMALVAGPAQAAPPYAPSSPGKASDWAPGDKDGFGTSRTLRSKVWYTINDGELTEVFFPRIDTPATRDTQLVVTDGETFADREDEDTDHTVELIDRRSPVYRQVNTATSGEYRITKTYVTDPDRSAVLVDVRFESLDGNPYEVYVLHDVGLGLNANDDKGRSEGGGLVATDGRLSGAVLASSGFSQTSSGYADRSDGWTDLRKNFMLDWSYTARDRGNVVQTGKTELTGLDGGQRLRLALGFGRKSDVAVRRAQAALARGFSSARGEYAAGWRKYLSSLDRVPRSAAGARAAYLASVMLLASHEDKTYRGGFIAAPGRPWAWRDELQHIPVYIAVWSRDLYQIATGLLAAGDTAAAERSLDYLWEVQQADDGSFPQNARLDGEEVFDGEQLDEVAFPIVLAWQLGRTGAEDWDNVRLSADYLAATGPRTGQERWENIGGYSPATIAAEIAGLVTAADIARKNSDAAR
ncbi:MAG: glycoside hydrolase family 15 protein, partial [Actinomycetota bacterium]|nr:glycoside hydrolase family 15 protein [Actinomycetota bacterium]